MRSLTAWTSREHQWLLGSTTPSSPADADPTIIDLTEPQAGVLSAMHGMGKWGFEAVADSLGQLLLCSAALHHTLDGPWEDPWDDDDDGVLLLRAEPSA